PRLGPIGAYLPPEGVRLAAVGFPVAGAGAGALCAWLLAVARRPGRAALAGALTVVAVAVDAGASFGFFYEWRKYSPATDLVAEAENSRATAWGGVRDRPGGLDRYLFLGGDIAPALPDFVGFTDYKGLYSVNGSGPLAPADFLEATGMISYGGTVVPDRLWRPQGRTLDLLRVTTVVATLSSPVPPADSPITGGGPVAGTALVRYDHDPALPEAFVVGRTEVRSRDDVLRGLWGDRPFDPAATALLERPCGSCPQGGRSGPAGRARRRSWSDNEASFDVVAARPAMLVVSQAWLPGWHASVGGKDAAVVRVDGLVQGVPVPAGRHRVVLRYTAPG
ncbi:MAG: YfhO family protein, partial [Acidimicrobiia bacterium]